MTVNTRKRGPRKPDSWGMDEWFMCFPGPWIESYIGLDNYQFRVGVTLLMLIYETDKPLTAPPRYLAGKCGMGVRKFNEVVEELIAAKKLTRTADGALTHPKCDEVLAIRRVYRAGKSHPSSSSDDAQREDSSGSARASVEQTAENENENNAGDEPEADRNSAKGKGKGSGSSSEPLRGSGAAAPPEFDPWKSGEEILLNFDPAHCADKARRAKAREVLGKHRNDLVKAAGGDKAAADDVFADCVSAVLAEEIEDPNLTPKTRLLSFFKRRSEDLKTRAVKRTRRVGSGEPEGFLKDGRMWLRDPVTGEEYPATDLRSAAA